MTPAQAAAELYRGAPLSTRHLQALGLPFNALLLFAMASPEKRREFVDAVVRKHAPEGRR